MSIRIISLNVRGLQEKEKRRNIFNHYRKRADILCLQETHSQKENEQQWSQEWGGEVIFAHGSSASRGVAILIAKNIRTQCKLSNTEVDMHGRYILTDMSCHENSFTIINLYAPNKDSPGFFKEIFTKCDKREPKLLFMGDFNLVLNVKLDRKDSTVNNDKSCHLIKTEMEERFLTDVWRDRNEDTKRYSWYRHGPAKTQMQASRIDFVISSKGFCNNITNVTYINGIGTDHSALVVILNCHKGIRGTGYWKMNTSHLLREDFKTLMCSIINAAKQDCAEGEDIIFAWERLKKEIAEEAKVYAKNLANEENEAIGHLCEYITDIEDKLEMLDEKQQDLLARSKADLEELTSKKARNLMFMSKVRWYEDGEKGTEYFHQLGKMRHNAKTCDILIDENGREVMEHRRILKMQRDFYQELFRSDPEVSFDIENESGIQIKEDSKAASEEPFSKEELRTAVRGLANGKTPGKDGIPAEFYKIFYGPISDLLLQLSQYVTSSSTMPPSSMEGVINLIPKNGKDSRLLSNLRPITLLNSDYKIMEKMVANRIQPSLKDIIHQDQQGFMSNRRISVNIRRVIDLINLCDKEDIPAILLQIDFAKCFDKLELCGITGAMNYFRFSQYLMDWISVLYKGFVARVQNNGNFSDTLEVSQSAHQGGVVSAFLFLLCAELMAIDMRANKRILGITFNEVEALLGQYADDTDATSLFDQESVNEIFKTLEKYRKQIGFQVNYDKTTVYRMGSIKNTDAMLYTQKQLHWTNIGVNVLGVTIRENDEEMLKSNYDPICKKITSIFQTWNRRNLSLFGKIHIINSLVASLFIYRMMVLPSLPKTYLYQIEKEMENFLWNGHKPKINLRTLQMDRKDGGANLVNLEKKEKALKCMWPNLLENDIRMKRIVLHLISDILLEDIWKTRLTRKDADACLHTVPTFWRDVLCAWSEYKTKTEGPSSFLWYNSEIRVGNRPILYRKAYHSGLKEIHQLYEQNQPIPPEAASARYDLSVMQYNSLISAISKAGLTNCPPTNSSLAVTTSEVYVALRRECIPTRLVTRWETRLQEDINYDDFARHFSNLNKITNVPKLRSFQYRLLHRAIVTNRQLYWWKIVSNPSCHFCEKAEESLLHLFCLCDEVKVVWTSMKEWMKKNNIGYEGLSFSPKNILFNCVHPKPGSVVNLLTLIVKQYVYRKRCLREPLSKQELKTEFYSVKNIEKFIAIKNEKLVTHEKKWS